jgi:hypothetical protein
MPERDAKAVPLAWSYLSARREVTAAVPSYAERRALEIGIIIAGGTDVMLLEYDTNVVFDLAIASPCSSTALLRSGSRSRPRIG